MRAVSGFVAVFLGVFYVVGFALLGSGLRNARRSNLAAAWPTAPATITSLKVSTNRADEGHTYEVEVRYSYTVGGVAYEGSRLAFGYAGSNGKDVHDEILRRLRDAKSVSARYDPADPSESCLSFGLHRSIQFALAFAATWLLFTLGMTLLWWVGSGRDTVLIDNLSVR